MVGFIRVRRAVQGVSTRLFIPFTVRLLVIADMMVQCLVGIKWFFLLLVKHVMLCNVFLLFLTDPSVFSCPVTVAVRYDLNKPFICKYERHLYEKPTAY